MCVHGPAKDRFKIRSTAAAAAAGRSSSDLSETLALRIASRNWKSWMKLIRLFD
ncbi:unnamed protein product [Rhodiola kirilowii]